VPHLKQRQPSTGERYRRSPGLVLYWSASGPACFDAITSRRTRVSPETVAFLDRLDKWQTIRALLRKDPLLGGSEDVRDVLEALVRFGLVQRRSETPTTRWAWQSWTPEAAFFHFGTRTANYSVDYLTYNKQLARKARTQPPPPPTKSMPGERVALPAAVLDRSVAATLHSRRTWRRFSPRPLSAVDLASLLRLTWGVQRWGIVQGQGRVALKTSPSGGARHSIEAYVVVQNVKGLTRGVYHYDAAAHELVDLKRSVDGERLAHLLADQRWFARAGAIVVMSAIFARAMWRYPSSRAYRAILAEAGHLAQTFCLVATARRLAPFCTMAFRDRELEALIGLDGINESAMYVVGAGTRPKGRIVHPGKVPHVGRFAGTTAD
jgi:SagB-type dehydrogenase family enzyme